MSSIRDLQVPLARKREISLEVHVALDRLSQGVSTLEETLAFIDGIEQNDPGDERQRTFYAAVRELARKVSEVKF